MERLNYNQLYYFYVIAKEGSVKAACKKLHLTQPTISGQLKILEDSLGLKLFERKYRKLELNANGKEILKKAEKIFVLGDELMLNLPNAKIKTRQELRIGAVPSLSNSFQHDFTLSLWKNDDQKASLVHGSLPNLIKDLDDDKLDIVLSDTPYLPSKRYRCVNLGTQNLVAVGTEKYSYLKKGFPESLNDIPYMAFTDNSQVQQDLNFFYKFNNIKPDIIGTVDDDAFVRLVTCKGKCVSILPEKSAKEALASKQLIRLGKISEVSSNFWALTSSLGSKRIIVRKLINDYLVRQKKK